MMIKIHQKKDSRNSPLLLKGDEDNGPASIGSVEEGILVHG